MSAPPNDARRRRAALWLLGAFVLSIFPASHYLFPLARETFRLPASPLDRTDGDRARQWLFLDACRAHVPAGAPVSIVAADGTTEMALFMMAIGVFAENQVLPHTYYLRETPDAFRRAEFVLVYRAGTFDPDLALVARVPDGAVYRRRPGA